MVPKVITHTALLVDAPNKKDRVRILDREARSKSKRHSASTSLSDNSTNVPITCSEMRSRTAQNNHTQGYVVHLRKNHYRLLLGYWNILTLTRKELILVEEAKKKYHLNFVGVSSWAGGSLSTQVQM